MHIFIDPGHGGSDPGAVNPDTGLREADVNLDICKRLGPIFLRSGNTIRYSRESDINVTLARRAEMANRYGADLFISVHCNAFDNETAGGTLVLFYQSGTAAERLAADIHEQMLLQTGLKDQGIYEARDLAVLRLTVMPAVLVETAFISNPSEAALLASAEFRQRCAQAIADGTTEFINLHYSGKQI